MRLLAYGLVVPLCQQRCMIGPRGLRRCAVQRQRRLQIKYDGFSPYPASVYAVAASTRPVLRLNRFYGAYWAKWSCVTVVLVEPSFIWASALEFWNNDKDERLIGPLMCKCNGIFHRPVVDFTASEENCHHGNASRYSYFQLLIWMICEYPLSCALWYLSAVG